MNRHFSVVYFRLSTTVQRVFNCDETQNVSLTPDKAPSMSMYRLCHHLQWSNFWSTLYVEKSTNRA